VLLDKIIVDGETFETESSTTLLDFSDPGRDDGFHQREVIAGGEIFRFDQDTTGATIGTRIRIDALGESGDENLQLQINGETVRNFRFDQSNTEQSFFFVTEDIVELEDIKLRFTNDFGLSDRSLTVNSYQTIDLAGGDREIANVEFDRVHSTRGEVPNLFFRRGYDDLLNYDVFSKGVTANGNGINQGFNRGTTLSSHGSFEIRPSGDYQRLRVDAQGSTCPLGHSLSLSSSSSPTISMTRRLVWIVT